MNLICGECGRIDCEEHNDSVATVMWEKKSLSLVDNLLTIGDNEFVFSVNKYSKININPCYCDLIELECIELKEKKVLLVRANRKTIFILEEYNMEGLL